MRAYIRDIFAEAVDQDFLVKDPARKLKVPAQLRATDTTTLTWDQIARELHLPKLTSQVIRRTIATLAQKKGTIKDVQGVMRHSRTATTSDVYMQDIPASVQSTINSINSELRKSDKQSRKKSKESAAAGTIGSSRRKPSSRVTQNDTKSWKGGSAPFPAFA